MTEPLLRQTGAAAEMAATRIEEKYVDLGARYIFEPIAVETLGVFNASARHLLDDLGRISENTGEARETSFLCQRISILVQRFNAVFCMTVCRLQTAQTDDRTQFCIYFSIFYLPRDYMYRGFKKIIVRFVKRYLHRVTYLHTSCWVVSVTCGVRVAVVDL